MDTRPDELRPQAETDDRAPATPREPKPPVEPNAPPDGDVDASLLIKERDIDPAVTLSVQEPGTVRDPQRQYALKYQDSFIVSDAHGDIRGIGDGLFQSDTCILSRFRLLVGNEPASVLAASVSQDNVLFTSNMSNSGEDGGVQIPHGVVHIARSRFLWEDRLYESIEVTNYWGRRLSVPIRFEFSADFRDMFEVRGAKRPRRGKIHEPAVGDAKVSFLYRGLDNSLRRSEIAFAPRPATLTGDSAEFLIDLEPRQSESLYIEIGTTADSPSRERFRVNAAAAKSAMRAKRRLGATLHGPNRVFNAWITRARSDIALLTTDLGTGPFPYAGIPWYSTTIGRDGVLAALQMLWLYPGLALGVLNFLAQWQGTDEVPFRDCEPGKILHEARRGEMTALRELPFGCYYGSVDVTPLFIHLAVCYAERTGDMATIDRLWPALSRAAGWMETCQDRTPHGFVSYQRARPSGLLNQGWKDSHDAIFHADGQIPPGPIALIEVQGYVFAAYKGLAALAHRRGEDGLAERWNAAAERLREAVERHFWMEDQQYYALAIDGEGRQCAVKASNASHLLFAGLPSPERAARVVEHLLSAHLYSGWGIRTLADDALPFNPMSYHNGSVWPHDTALCAAGFARYGRRDAAIKLTSDLFEAAVHFQLRLPELFCGFERSPGEAPVAYPVACVPQAWSAGAPFMLVQTCLGITIDGWNNEIQVERPRLPVGIESLSIRHLQIGENSVDLHFRQLGDRVACYLDERHEGLGTLVIRQ